jgi:hypothetical protein
MGVLAVALERTRTVLATDRHGTSPCSFFVRHSSAALRPTRGSGT